MLLQAPPQQAVGRYGETAVRKKTKILIKAARGIYQNKMKA